MFDVNRVIKNMFKNMLNRKISFMDVFFSNDCNDIWRIINPLRNAFVGKMMRMFALFVPPVRHFWSIGTVLVLTFIGVGLEACKTHVF